MDGTATEESPRLSRTLSLKRPSDRSDDGTSSERPVPTDDWEVSEEEPEVAKKDVLSTPPKFSEIAKVREEILEQAVHDLNATDNAIGSRVSRDVVEKLRHLRGDKRAEKIREIISDPTKNSKQILETLTAMKNGEGITPKLSTENIPDQETAIIAEALKRIDAVSRSTETVREADFDAIAENIDKGARFLVTELETARLNGVISEKEVRNNKDALTRLRTSVSKDLKAYHEGKGMEKELIELMLTRASDEIKSYSGWLNHLKEKKSAKKAKERRSSRVTTKAETSIPKEKKNDDAEVSANVTEVAPVVESVAPEVAVMESDSNDVSDKTPLSGDIDVSGIGKNKFGLSKGKIRATEKDMVRTAEEAAKREPFFIGGKRKAHAAADASSEEKVESEGEEIGRLRAEILGNSPVSPEEPKKQEEPALLQSESGIETPNREDLEKELKHVLRRLQEKSEQSAKAEQEKLNAKEYWEEAVDLRERHIKSMKGIFGSFFSPETLKNLEEEEAEDERRYEKMSERAEELKKEMNILKSRRDELERELEDMPVGKASASEPLSPEKSAAKAEDRVESEENRISQTVLSKFESLGLNAEHLTGIEGFSALSEGQQLLVCENLKQLVVGRIQEEAIDRADKDMKEDTNWVRKGWKTVSRKYQIAKAEKLTEKEIMSGGIAVHGDILKELVKGTLAGPEVVFDPDRDEIRVHFASGKQFADIPEGERGILDAFNASADEFSAVPAEWQYADSAKKKNNRQYIEKENRYAEATRDLLDFLKARYGEDEALWTINDLDGKVRMMQFLQTTRDADMQLRSIRNDAAWTRMWKDSVTDYGVSFALGFGGRTAAAATAGFLAASMLPAVVAGAGLAGGLRAYIRSREQLKEKERRSRKGRGSEDDPVRKKIGSADLVAELEDLASSSIDSFGEGNQEERSIALRASLDAIRMKLEKGMVDFGTEQVSAGNEYALLSALSRASAVVAMYSAEQDSRFQKRMDAVIAGNERYFKDEDARAKEKRSKFLIKTVARGAMISAGSAALGYGARYAAEQAASLADVISDRMAVPAGEPKTLEHVLNPPEAPEAPEPSPIPAGDFERSSVPLPEPEARQIPDPWSEEVAPESETGIRADTVHESSPDKASVSENVHPAQGISSMISQEWNEAAATATLGENPRPEVALSNEALPDSADADVPEAAMGMEEAGMNELTEKPSGSDAVAASEAPDTTSMIMEAKEAGTAPVETVSGEASVPSAPLDAAGTAESAPAPVETPKVPLGDTRMFVSENPDMLEPLKREVGGYRMGIFRTAETEADLNHDYIHAGLGKVQMLGSLESYEYGKPSDLDMSQLRNLSEFRENTEKAFMMKLGEQEGRNLATVAPGETIDDYTKRVATIALQLGVKIEEF